MEISRLIFSKDTKEKMNKSLSTRGKREVLWNNLKEISDNGKLAMCKSRKEVGRMVGYPMERERAGYLWVTNMIHQGKLKETVMGIDNNGYMEYDYKLVENPVLSKDTRDDWGTFKAKGKIRFDKLKELDRTGVLATVKTRREIAELIDDGEEESKTIYSWVSNLISQGHIKESNMRLNEEGKLEADYELTGTEPRYGKVNIKTTKKESNKMSNKKISKREKGKIRWDRLVECDKQGLLAKCRTRKDVAKLVGYKSNEMHSGYSWVMNMLTRKHLLEKKIGVDKHGMWQYEFSLGEYPNYRLGKGSVKKKSEPQIIEGTTTIDRPTEESNAKVVITYGELKIELSDVSADTLKDLVINMFNKVRGE